MYCIGAAWEADMPALRIAFGLMAECVGLVHVSGVIGDRSACCRSPSTRPSNLKSGTRLPFHGYFREEYAMSTFVHSSVVLHNC